MKISEVSMKTKFIYKYAAPVAEKLIEVLEPSCERIAIAGSIRRMQAAVSDVEIIYVPKVRPILNAGEMFPTDTYLPDLILKELEVGNQLVRRFNAEGEETWGPRIKLAVHKESTVPIDFFSIEGPSWWNYLVCRTGPAESNMRIAKAARERGWKWKPYSPGFCRVDDPAEKCAAVMESEHEVFEFVGLPYLEPQHR
jgi:DNA polymerase/3'-5' exonuclease PolX